jgi:hypothetical protein
MRASKQRLIPVKVPWQVSVSASFLKLLAYESATDGPAQVSFVAQFGCLEQGRAGRDALVGHSVDRVSSPYDGSERQPLDGKEGYQLVHVSFERGLWIRMLPGFSESEILDPNSFDTSALLPLELSPKNLNEIRKTFWQNWIKSGVCPDPRMYEVEESSWLEELRLTTKGYRHIVICGHDAFIEIIAKSWNWKSGGALRCE